jgi:hypothetical protein
MKINMAIWDRVLRLFVGTLLVAWAVAGGPWWAYLGLVLLGTSAWRFCPIYAALRTGTRQDRSRGR